MSGDFVDWPRAGRSRWMIVIVAIAAALGAVAGATGGWWWSSEHVDERKATVVILIHPLEGNAFSPNGRGDELVNLETEAELVRSDAVAGLAGERLSLQTTPAELLEQVTVTVPPNTQLLEITVTDRDPDSAALRADTIAEVFLEFRRARTESAVSGLTQKIEELITDRERERERLQDALAADGDDKPSVAEQIRIDEITAEISSLGDQLAVAEATSRDPGQVVTPASVEPPGLLADDAVVAILGGLLGGAAGLALGWLATRRHRRAEMIWTLDDLDELEDPAGGDPVEDLGVRCGPVAVPVSVDSAAVTDLRSAIRSGPTPRHVVVCASATPSDPVAVHTALVESLVRARYEVISVDLGREEDRAALVDLALDGEAVDEVIAGRSPFLAELVARRPADDRGSDEFEHLVASVGMVNALGELAKRADVVLVSAPLPAATAAPLVACADAVVIETHAGRSRADDVRVLSGTAARAGTPVAGVVHVEPSRSRRTSGLRIRRPGRG